MEEPKDIYEAFSPLYNVGKIFGLNPMKFNKEKQEVEMSKISIFMSLIIGLIGCVSSILAQYYNINGTNEPLSEASFWFDIYSSVLIQSIGIILNCINIRSLCEVINCLSKIDQLVKKIGCRVTYWQIKKFCFKGLSFIFLEFTLTAGCEMYYYLSSYKGRLNLAMSYIPILTNGIIKLQFTTFVYIIKVRFKSINSILREMGQFTTPNSAEMSFLNLPQYFKEFNRNISKEKIKTVHKIQNLLCKLCRRVNHLYGIQNLIITGSSFNIIVNELYSCYAFMNNIKDNVADIYFSIQWSLFQLLEIFILVWLCSSTQKEISKTASLLHTIQRISNDEELNESIKLFSLHQLHTNVEFTAFGLFPINYGFLLTIISSLTSYLVIMIQYDMAKQM